MSGGDGGVRRSFSLSGAARAAGTATPAADRRERRAFWAWLPAMCMAVAAAYGVAGLAAGAAAGACCFAAWRILGTRTGRRRRELWRTPFLDRHEKFLIRRIPHYRSLDAAGRELFRKRAQLLLDEVAFHGAGVAVRDGLRLRAAAAAVTPTLGFEEWEWPGLKEIVFRPEGYEQGFFQEGDGMVVEYGESGMVGDSGVMSGMMMLSSRDLAWEFAHPEEGANVGIHEFAHLMTAQGLALAEGDGRGWAGLVEAERARIRRGVSLLDEYALLNEDEFFAVATELFFTVPIRFRSWHRKLYGVLSRCYRQDPAEWLDTGEPEPDGPPRRRRKGRVRPGAERRRRIKRFPAAR